MTNEVTQVAGNVVESLRQQPALLVIVVLNAMILGMGVWVLLRVSDTTRKDREWQQHLIDRCYEGREKT